MGGKSKISKQIGGIINEIYGRQIENQKRDSLEGLRKAQFTCLDYRDVVIPDGSIVYCDPPYAKTTSYTTGFGIICVRLVKRILF